MSRANYTYAAYDAGLPCRNTECKSHGLPHPNCRCYGDLPESPQSATQMVLPNGRWGRDFSGGFSPSKGAPDSSNAAASANLGAPSEVPANNAATGSPIDAGKAPSPGISPNGVSPSQGVATNVPAPSPMDYANSGESPTDITPAGTNKATTGFGLGTAAIGAGLGLAAMGVIGMNFLRRKKAPKEKESDYEDGVMALAEGGEVGKWQVVDHYCQTCRPHRPDCEYFAEGGQAGDSDFVTESTPTITGPEQRDVAKQVDPTGEDWVTESAPAPEQKAPVQSELAMPQKQPQAAPNLDSSDWVSESTGKPTDAPKDHEMTWQGIVDEHLNPKGNLTGAEVEALAKGFIGAPIVALGEIGLSKLGVPGMSAEDQKKRQQDNPDMTTIMGGLGNAISFGTGVGEVGWIAKKIGGNFFRDAIAGGVIQGLNEVEKSIVEGKDHDLLSGYTLANIGGAALLQGAFGKAERAFRGVGEQLVGTRVKSALAGVSAAVLHPDDPDLIKTIGKQLYNKTAEPGYMFDQKAFKSGVKFAQSISNKAGTGVALTAIRDVLQGQWISASETLAAAIAGKAIGGKLASQVATGFINSSTHGGFNNFANTVDSVGRSVSGQKKIIDGVSAALKGTGFTILNSFDGKDAISSMDKAVNQFDPEQQMKQQIQLDNSEPAQGYAEGGNVSSQDTQDSGLTSPSQAFANNFPEQNVIMQMARGRMSQYLKGLQPQPPPTALPFDSKSDLREQDRSYKKALLIAHDPLSVLGHVAKGTLEPEHLQHLGAMYPEVSQTMQKEITKQMLQMQMKGEKPSYKVRQGLSLLLGAPLSGEFLPQNMQAAQAVFVKADQSQQPGKKPTKTKQSLSKSSKAFLTPEQSRQTRYQQRG